MVKDWLLTHLRSLLFVNAYYLILAYAATEGAGFVFWIIAARLYSSTETGLGATAISATMLLATFSTMGLPHALVRFLPEAKASTRTLINSSFFATTAISAIAGVIFLAGLSFWTPGLASLRDNFVLLILFVIFAITAALRPSVLNIFMARRRGGYTLLVGSLDGIIKLGAISVLALLLGEHLRSFGVYIAWGIAIATPVCLSILFFIPYVYNDYRPRISLHPSSLNKMLRFSLANYVSELSWFSPASGLIGWIIVLIVVNLLGLEDTAYFYVVWLIAAFLNVIPVSISTSLLVEGSHREDTLYINARKSMLLATAVLVPVVVLVFLLGDVFLLIFGKEYSEHGTNLLRILSLSSLPLAFNSISLGIWRVQRKLKPVIIIGVTIALLSIGLIFVLSPELGILSPGVAWLIAQFVAAVGIGRTAWRRDSVPNSNQYS